MQRLEKILNEIESKKEKCLDVVRVELDPMEITIHREQYKGLRMAEQIIHKHMSDDWISVKERLPEKENKNYLVTYRTPRGRYHVKEAYCEYVGETPRVAYWTKRINGEVVAWMPLPEPYYPERSDK